MAYGICLLSVVPARKEPSGTSEMVTQLLFGEHYTVLEDNGDWLQIKTAFDSYTCWLSGKQHTRITESTFKQLEKQPSVYCAEIVHVLHNKLTETGFPLTIGAALPHFHSSVSSIESYVFGFDGQTVTPHTKKKSPDIISTSFLFMNAPYLWGGKSPFGIDCSGFSQLVYKLNGYKLPRDAYQQVELGTALTFVEEAEAGDLAFFDNEDGRITHVGILLNNHQIIHASGFVRVDKFDHYGIYNSDKKKYTHTLRVIKRIL